ncbi:MAG: lasso peptide biosynthesis B2 protein [Gammaproteobacteria bacterium]|nr:MAG: lasso peptide biosynthesis B2 protein [Gammaproteobacteria bacterium]RKZ71932.1 MAG: lasso peptide biosynthesis B2 protein [Gammaproteobacteria bacterium]
MLKNRLRQLAELSLLQWWIILVAIFTLPMIALSLKLSGFKQTKNRMSRLIPNRTDDISAREDDLSRAQFISRAVAIAGNHGVYHANCLKQSLLLWWLLARRGIPCELKLGTQKLPQETFSAHAWVEYKGETLGDSSRFQHQFLVS